MLTERRVLAYAKLRNDGYGLSSVCRKAAFAVFDNMVRGL